MVAAASDTAMSEPQNQSGDVKVHMSVRPRQGGGKTGVWWTADSGIRMTLLEEKDWMKMKKTNPNLKLKRNHVDFRHYGTKIILPVMPEWGEEELHGPHCEGPEGVTLGQVGPKGTGYYSPRWVART